MINFLYSLGLAYIHNPVFSWIMAHTNFESQNEIFILQFILIGLVLFPLIISCLPILFLFEIYKETVQLLWRNKPRTLHVLMHSNFTGLIIGAYMEIMMVLGILFVNFFVFSFALFRTASFSQFLGGVVFEEFTIWFSTALATIPYGIIFILLKLFHVQIPRSLRLILLFFTLVLVCSVITTVGISLGGK